MGALRIRNGPLAGQTFDVTAELVIGREGAGAKIDDALVSRRHAVVRASPGGLEVEDLGSTNGTFVDGVRLEGKAPVTDGAEIRVGTTVLEVYGVVPQDVTRPRMPDPEVTRFAAPVADPDATRARAARPEVVAAEPLQPSPASAPPEPVAAQPGQPAPEGGVSAPRAAPVEEFRPPAMRRSSGLASRSWMPVVLSFGSVVLTAIALVIYFAAR